MSPSFRNMFTGRNEMGKPNMENYDRRQFLALVADSVLLIQEVSASLFVK